MSEDDYISPTGKWPDDAATLPKKLSALDGAIAKRVNADDGGGYFPTAPIIFVSQSHQLTLNAGGVTGSVTTRRGGRLTVPAAPTFVDAFDVPQNRTRTLYWPIVPRLVVNPRAPDRFYSRDLGATVVRAAVGTTIAIPIPTRLMHHGATLSTVTLAWRCGQPRALLPAVQSGMDILRALPVNGGGASLKSGAPVLVGAASTDDYYNGGAVQTLSYACDQHNVIDTTQYHYFFQWILESGSDSVANNNDQLVGLMFSYTAIPGMGTE